MVHIFVTNTNKSNKPNQLMVNINIHFAYLSDFILNFLKNQSIILKLDLHFVTLKWHMKYFLISLEKRICIPRVHLRDCILLVLVLHIL